MYGKKIISVTSLTFLPLSQTVTPSRTPSLLERDVLYGRPQSYEWRIHNRTHDDGYIYMFLTRQQIQCISRNFRQMAC